MSAVRLISSNTGTTVTVGSGGTGHLGLGQGFASVDVQANRDAIFRTASKLTQLTARKLQGDRTGSKIEVLRASGTDTGGGSIAFTSTNGEYEDTTGLNNVAVGNTVSLRVTGGTSGTTSIGLDLAAITCSADNQVWATKVNATGASSASAGFAIACKTGTQTVVVVRADGSGNVKCCKSTDEGSTYGSESTIASADSVQLDRPLVYDDVSGRLHLFYSQQVDSASLPAKLCYRHSDDDGATWSSETVIDNGSGHANNTFWRVSAYANNGTVYLTGVSADNVAFNSDGLFFWKSTDGGATWAARSQLFSGTANSPTRPDLAVGASGRVHLGWLDKRNGSGVTNSGDVYYAYSDDGGSTWSTDTRMTTTTTALRPTICADAASSTVTMIYQDPADSTADLYSFHSADNGATFTGPTLVISSSGSQEHAYIVQSGQYVALIYSDHGTTPESGHYMLSTNYGATFAPNEIPFTTTNDNGAGRLIFTKNGIIAATTDGTTGVFTAFKPILSATVTTVNRMGVYAFTGFANASETTYWQPGGRGNGSATTVQAEGEWLVKLPTGVDHVTIRNLYAFVSSNARTTTTTISVNGATGAGTTPSVSYGSTATGAKEDTTNSIQVKDGDKISIKVVTGSGSGTLQLQQVVIEVQSDDDVFHLVASDRGGVSMGTTSFASISGALRTTTTEANAQIKWDLTSWKLSLLTAYVKTAGTSSHVKLDAGGSAVGSPSAVDVATTAGGAWVTDTSNTYTPASSDELSLSSSFGSAAATVTCVAITAQAGRIVPASISSTSAVTGSIARLRPVTTSTISSTSAVTASVVRLAAVRPASISSTSAIAGTVSRLAAVRPASIAASSTISAGLRALRAIRPAAISATSTVMASLQALRGVTSDAVTSTSTIAGSLVALRGVVPVEIHASSTVTGAVDSHPGPLMVVPAAINASSTLGATIARLAAVTGGGVTATSTITARVRIAAGDSGRPVAGRTTATLSASGRTFAGA